MSGWGMGWFGGGGGSSTTSSRKKDAPKTAILQLRETLDMLSKREKHLGNQIDEQDALARKYVNTNKAAAKAALMRKKQYEHSLEQTTKQMMTVEREIGNIETANINKETFMAMKQASVAIHTIHGDLTIDKVDKTMEDLREGHAVQEEIAEALTQGAGANSVMDDDDILEELEQLQQEELDNKMLDTSVPANQLPAVAAKEPKSKAPKQAVQEEEDDEDEVLRKLQAEMAM